MRLGLDHFPFPVMAERIWRKYYIQGGKSPHAPYVLPALQTGEEPRELAELRVAANFVEVFLARQGHNNAVGINYMEKLQFPHLASIYGAMLAGVGYVLMGAGIPTKVPAVFDQFSRNEPATYPLYVTGAGAGDAILMRFNPQDFAEGALPMLNRPRFLAIISSSALALTLAKKSNGLVDGFVIEGPTAGGHNAPPRGQLQLDHAGEPVYGERDRVDLSKIRELGRPFWLAGGYGSPDALRTALNAGAAGVQVGTAFAFCDESGMRDDYKRAVIGKVLHRNARVFTNPLASPTGFPFKVVSLEGTISEAIVFHRRPRVCDLGFLREAYRNTRGQVVYRCPAEPVSAYLSKGGTRQETERRTCLCNALVAAIGQPQTRGNNYVEPGVVTAGDDLAEIGRFLAPGADSYHAADVIALLLSGVPKSAGCAAEDNQEETGKWQPMHQ